MVGCFPDNSVIIFTSPSTKSPVIFNKSLDIFISVSKVFKIASSVKALSSCMICVVLVPVSKGKLKRWRECSSK